VAQAGLARMYETFDFVQSDGKALKLGEALKTVKGSFETHTIRGTRAKPVRPEIKVGALQALPHGVCVFGPI
jgi:hypothetical protein